MTQERNPKHELNELLKRRVGNEIRMVYDGLDWFICFSHTPHIRSQREVSHQSNSPTGVIPKTIMNAEHAEKYLGIAIAGKPTTFLWLIPQGAQ